MELSAKLKHYRLNQDEYKKILEVLGREPQGVEWALFSALWSEHCSYKSSKVHLKKFFNKTERVLESFGENAGVIDLGEGERVAFKMESHNHPSYIEPYQGAATGVGGILRDIFTMGARPLALANFLCFGEAKASRMTHLVDGVVRGIAGYGNCVGVPTVTGQTEFHPSYNGNILVNAFALGLFRPDMQVVNSKARGTGNYVVYVGAKTGRDGVHGASMASESFDDNSESKKPTVQIGDPFFEKLLIESCLEVMEKDLVVAIQDMGAAGLTSSSFEMASKGGVGLTLHLDQVPLRDSTITPEEILLSESQERMLLVCEPAKFEDLKAVFDHWNLDASIVGEVKDEKTIDLYWHGEIICSIDPDVLVENAPMYERPYDKWENRNRAESLEKVVPQVDDPNEQLLKVLKDLRGTSREWVYRQYDQRVGGATSRDATDSVAVMRLPDSGRALGLVLGCRPFMMRWDARQGGMDAVAYPALELAAKGFEPLALTDCLNFGNPEKPELMSEFVAAVEGMSETCEALRTPVISGNVSFYNETLNKNVTSTPSTGLVGLRPELGGIPKSYFTGMAQGVYLVRLPQVHLNGQWSEMETGQPMKGVGEFEVQGLMSFTKLITDLGRQPYVYSSRLVGKFGLAYALARMCLPLGVGVRTAAGDWFLNPRNPGGSLFAETCYEVLFAVDREREAEFKELAKSSGTEGLRVYKIGETGGDRIVGGRALDVPIDQARRAYDSGWEANFEGLE
ncbi:MAG: phosphoribosylformylglycinamidine synthase subunit PurL [Bdellovibrionaceae bacterium]|nr:phosphoribosylformylglycinamidine synthase subunit PurL [Bdellovibrionales bacterium]MCB9083900.1 phosphoribosylformylglycinamidine synthase subunit PurL [Pseudobdellovibrionaceae bacterium]